MGREFRPGDRGVCSRRGRSACVEIPGEPVQAWLVLMGRDSHFPTSSRPTGPDPTGPHPRVGTVAPVVAACGRCLAAQQVGGPGCGSGSNTGPGGVSTSTSEVLAAAPPLRLRTVGCVGPSTELF